MLFLIFRNHVPENKPTKFENPMDEVEVTSSDPNIGLSFENQSVAYKRDSDC
jgi:hypothetical protein